MNKILIDIYKNWRTSDGEFETDVVCSCGRSTEVYAEIPYGDKKILMCKGCLKDIQDRINESYINHMKEGKRI